MILDKFNGTSEETEKQLLLKWPKVSNYNLLWHCNYYDGPIDGILEVDGINCKFVGISKSTDKNDNYFLIISLTDQQYKEFEWDQELFERYVGNNNTYPARNVGIEIKHPKQDWDKYYKAGTNKILDLMQNIDEGKVVGWFKL